MSNREIQKIFQAFEPQLNASPQPLKNRLFNTPHFHVVFTLPHESLSLWRYNEALFTKIIFKASQQTLFELIESDGDLNVRTAAYLILRRPLTMRTLVRI